jgi:hypothetical protein
MAATLNAMATPTPTIGVNQVATSVAATLTAMALPADTPAPVATATEQPPTETSAPSATATQTAPACLPAHPGAQSLPSPAGVAIGLDENIALYDLQGTLLANRPATGMTFMDSEHAHLAGSLSAGANDLPVVYFTLQGGGTLRKNVNNLITDLLSAGNLPFFVGVEGNRFMVYTTIDLMNQWTNSVFAGNLADLPGMAPRLTWVPPEDAHIGNTIRPLAVRTDGGDATGFWYTYTMVGIGNVIYPPYNGLFYFDLDAGASVEYLPPSDALGGISPDQTLVAYGPGQGGFPGVIRDSVTIRNLVTCQETVIPFNPVSNLGGGWMVFSPENRMVAWTEANGPNNMEASFRLRVARTDGTSLFDSPLANLGGFLGGEAPNSLSTRGWAANHVLVMQMYLQATQSQVVVIWAPDPAQPLDPALGAHQSIPLANGEFIGLLYP